ncbi:MAG: hypothetical protein D6707_08115 [Bacteroidetes bacterium]|nr:MAG: hypothetical protein D6707_08115 [Bacteroidota bacterium]
MKRFFIFFTAIILLNACRKDRKDKIFPEIKILSPADYSDFTASDTIPVQAEVSDDRQISYIFVQLMDENMRPADKRLDIASANQKQKTFSVGYVISNTDLSSGIYWLKIEASDGVNVSKEYVQLYIYALPVEREGVVVVSQPSADNTLVDLLYVEDNSTVNLANLSNDFLDMAVSSKFHQVVIIPEYYNKAAAIDARTQAIEWQITEAYNYPSPTFTSFYAFNNEYFTGIYQWGIKGYDESGYNIYQIPFSNEISYALYKDEDYTFSVNQILGNNYMELVVYYAQSGSEKWRTSIDLDNRIEIFRRNATQYFVFGNDANNQARVFLYDVSNGGYFEPYSFSAGFYLNDVEQISSDDFLIAATGGIYMYEYNSSSVTNRISAGDVSTVKVDTLNKQILFSENNKLLFYGLTDYSSQGYYSHPYPIRDFEVLYTK